MGFLDIFKKKKEPQLPKELQGYMDNILKTAFPGGKAEIDSLVSIIISLTNNRIPESDVQSAVLKTGTLLTIADNKTEKRIVNSITASITSISADEAKVIYNVMLGKMAERMYGSAELAPILSKSLGNVDCSPIHDNYGPLGSDTNPLPVCGIPASHGFVSKLELEDGTPVTIKRFGSGNVDVCDETVDFYDAFDGYGRKVASFVICPYCPETSNEPPAGFRFKN